ncbi:helix-turn-helix domain-containing protein [Roseococcus sp. DSY-14]|uniref:helix-turn-helix domain-containing protein n=1 Tax=Roseococcus sp. DSY-14 TaxID=3369650 RepID=UPI00387AC314
MAMAGTKGTRAKQGGGKGGNETPRPAEMPPAADDAGALPPFAQRLRARARHLGLSDAEVARRAGLGQPRYSNYSNGIREPALDVLVAIARALETTPDRLLGVAADIDTAQPGNGPADQPRLHRDLQDLLDLVALLPPDRHRLAVALLRAVLHEGAGGGGGETASRGTGAIASKGTAAAAKGAGRPTPSKRARTPKSSR